MDSMVGANTGFHGGGDTPDSMVKIVGWHDCRIYISTMCFGGVPVSYHAWCHPSVRVHTRSL